MSDISTQDVDAFLAHHGVKGQRWGRRKQKKSTGRIFVSMTPQEKEKWKQSPRYRSAKRDANRTLVKLVASVSVGVGTGRITRKVLNRAYGRSLQTEIAAMGASYVGTMAAAKILDLNGSRKARSLVRRAGNAP